MRQATDIVIVGAGAAGLAAGIFAAEAAKGKNLRIVILDGARKPGAKILVSGGGRCNVTNERVTPEDYWGGNRKYIRNVLRAFDEKQTVSWFRDLGVHLKIEPSGKYFPVSDRARTVLDALFSRARDLGIEIRPSTRIQTIRPIEGGFHLDIQEKEPICASKVIMATGGLALPKSGSDGAGLRMAEKLGHQIVPTTPALVPLILGEDSSPAGQVKALSGMTLHLRLSLENRNGKRLEAFTDSLLFTHFGISGPAALNMSRHWLRSKFEQPVRLTMGHPDLPTEESARDWITERSRLSPKRLASTALADLFPERLARLLGEGMPQFNQLSRAQRGDLAARIAALPLLIDADRGYAFAETTAGGVQLPEIDYRTMESRLIPGLFLCGEMLDVDGRIGGFNFQWAWSSGYLAGRGAAMS